KRRERGDRAALYDARLDEHPRGVADRRDRLVRLGEVGREAHGALVGAQEVAVRDAARDQQAVVVAGADLVERAVDLVAVRVVEVVEALDLARLEAHELGCRARVLERLARLGELNLLDAVRREDRDLRAIKPAGHVWISLSRRFVAAGVPARRRGQTADPGIPS